LASVKKAAKVEAKVAKEIKKAIGRNLTGARERWTELRWSARKN
jgi:hypothetical protein